jgi:hypothetical protein
MIIIQKIATTQYCLLPARHSCRSTKIHKVSLGSVPSVCQDFTLVGTQRIPTIGGEIFSEEGFRQIQCRG